MKKGPMKITAAQKKLPANLQKAIIAKEKKEGKTPAMMKKESVMKMKKAAPMKEMKGDLDKDGKLSGYEANRQNKIEEAMKKDSSNKI